MTATDRLEPSNRTARAAGLLYLLMGLPAPFGLIYVPGKLIVSGNAAATANNILGHEMLFRTGMVSVLASNVAFIVLALALYRLLSGVNKTHAALMVILVAVSVAIAFLNEVNNIAALTFFRGTDFLAVFDKPQRDALAMLFLRLHNHGLAIDQIFWGLWLFPFGFLVMRSGFLPRILGILLIVNCFAYVAASLTSLLFPGFDNVVFKAILPALLGELWIMAWLLIKGVKSPRLAAASTLALALLLAAGPAAAQQGPVADAGHLYEAGKYDEANTALSAYATAHPQDAEAAYWQGRTLLALHDTDQAVEWLEKATTLQPRSSEAWLRLGRAYGRAAQEASLFRKPGLAKSARAAWEKAVAADPDNLDARADLVQFHVMAPGFMGGSVDEARLQAAEIGRRDARRGALASATIALSQKDEPGAERILKEALAKSPGDAQIRSSLASLYQSQQKWEAAFATYDAMLADDPNAWDVLYQVGRAAALSGQRLDGGAAALQRYLGHLPGPESPPLANAHYRLGMIYERQGDKAHARGEYQAALRLDPKLADAKAALAKLG